MFKSKFHPEVIFPDFSDDDTTTTTTNTKSRRVSFGTNHIKEFIVGSAVSAQCVSEYEQAFSSSDSSNANSSHSAVESNSLNQNTFVIDDNLINPKILQSIPIPEQNGIENMAKFPKFSSTICFSADSPTADMEFTGGCINLAKSILEKKNKEMTVIIHSKPKFAKEEVPVKDETKYFEGTQFDMSMTSCFKSKESRREEQRFTDGERTKVFNESENEMTMTRCSNVFRVKHSSIVNYDESDISSDDSCKENKMPLNMIMQHLDKDSSDADDSLFNPEKSLNDFLNANPFNVSYDLENLNESMDITKDNFHKQSLTIDNMNDHSVEDPLKKWQRSAEGIIKLSEQTNMAESDMSIVESHVFETVNERNDKEISNDMEIQNENMHVEKPLDELISNQSAVEGEILKSPEQVTFSTVESDSLVSEPVVQESKAEETEGVMIPNISHVNTEFEKDNSNVEATLDNLKDMEMDLDVCEPVQVAEMGEYTKGENQLPLQQQMIIDDPVLLNKSGHVEQTESKDMAISSSIENVLDQTEEMKDLNESKSMDGAKKMNDESQSQQLNCTTPSLEENAEDKMEEIKDLNENKSMDGAKEMNDESESQQLNCTTHSLGENAEDKMEEIKDTMEIDETLCAPQFHNKSTSLSREEKCEVENSPSVKRPKLIQTEAFSRDTTNTSSVLVKEIENTDGDTLNMIISVENIEETEKEIQKQKSPELVPETPDLEESETVPDMEEPTTEEEKMKTNDEVVEEHKEEEEKEPKNTDLPSFTNDSSETTTTDATEEGDGCVPLVDGKILENLKRQSLEPGCVWSVKETRYRRKEKVAHWVFEFKILESFSTLTFGLEVAEEDDLDSCSLVKTGAMNLVEENTLRRNEYRPTLRFGYEQLNKYLEQEKKMTKTILNVPYFLDQINSFAIKLNSFLGQIYTVLTEYPGSRLNGSHLTFRLYSFPILFSTNVIIDLSDVYRLSSSSLAFDTDFGCFNEAQIRKIFGECLELDNFLCEFIIRSTRYLVEVERETGYVSKRNHIQLLREFV